MGDAECEHLLLAAKKVSHVRRIHRVGLTQAIVGESHEAVVLRPELMRVALPADQAEEIVARARLGLEFERDSDDDESEFDELEGDYAEDETPKARTTSIAGSARPFSATPNGKVTPPSSPSKRSPQRPPQSGRPGSSVPTTPSSRRVFDVAVEHSSGASGGFDHLLQAAHVLEEDHVSPTAGRLLPSSASMSGTANPGTKRRRSLTTEAEWQHPSASRQALQSLQREDDSSSLAHPTSDSYLSALDVLAEASASQDDPHSPRKRSRTESADGRPFAHSGLAPKAPVFSTMHSSPVYQGPQPNGLAGPAMILIPPKPERAPYIKWNVEEDEELVRAVLQHGLRWDQVAGAVTTRSYHQVRQRFLRGLKCEFVWLGGCA